MFFLHSYYIGISLWNQSVTFNADRNCPEAVAQGSFERQTLSMFTECITARYAAFILINLACQDAPKDSIRVRIMMLGCKTANAFVDCDQLDMVLVNINDVL